MTLESHYFIRVDTILHVYQIWVDGSGFERSTRSFGVNHYVSHRPFIFLGVGACQDWIENWQLTPSYLQFLRKLEALQYITDEGFWKFLETLKFDGKIRGVPEGTLLSVVPVTVSPAVQASEGSDPSVDLFVVEASHILLEILSEGIAAIISFHVEHGGKVHHLLKAKIQGIPPGFGSSERINHPYWGREALGAEISVGCRYPLEADYQKRIWIYRHFNDSEDTNVIETEIKAYHDLDVYFFVEAYIDSDQRMFK